MKKEPISIFWFRRDLRLYDNAGLYHALKNNERVLPIFIFDSDILEKLQNKSDRRVQFIHREVSAIKKELIDMGSDLLIFHDQPFKVWEQLLETFEIKNVYCNHDYEPYAKERDSRIQSMLTHQDISFRTFKDQCIFEHHEILKDDGTPYTVYTPFMKKWKDKLKPFYLKSYPNALYFKHFYVCNNSKAPSMEDLGFKTLTTAFPEKSIRQSLIQAYDKFRDFPGVEGTSRLSLHFRFGTISIREKARKAMALNEKWLNELIWRDFYMYILAHFPHVAGHAFKPAYDKIEWRNNEDEFKAWCEGRTGFPIVDAGMRELNTTGFMHNRVRMIVASFLCKDLLIDWRWGEAYFAGKLLDFELASNNGGWQWAAGSGVDAAPYFRVFNPDLQTDKFDPQRVYIKKWVPEYQTAAYPRPIVDHAFARKRCLEVYKVALKP